MDKLWAPWRLGYLVGLTRKTKGCLFCRIHRESKDKKNFIFSRTRHSFAVLNIYPYNNGHVMVIPRRHVADLVQLTQEEKDDLFRLLEKTKLTLDRILKPEGYNIGMNLGRVAGAGFPGHLHIHVVPRWHGDVNFMPVVSDTKVISQSLETLYQKIKNAHSKRN